jgi:cytochrome c1
MFKITLWKMNWVLQIMICYAWNWEVKMIIVKESRDYMIKLRFIKFMVETISQLVFFDMIPLKKVWYQEFRQVSSSNNSQFDSEKYMEWYQKKKRWWYNSWHEESEKIITSSKWNEKKFLRIRQETLKNNKMD